MSSANHVRRKVGWVDIRVGALLRRALTAWLRERKRKCAIHELQALNDRALADIGIDRSEIESVVYGAARDRFRHRH